MKTRGKKTMLLLGAGMAVLLCCACRMPGKVKALSEEELLAVMEKNADHLVENHLYADLDHDGAGELLGTFMADGEGYYQVWYCSSDGKTCELVHENSEWMDYGWFEPLNLGEETHAAANANRTMGTVKNYSILSLRDGKIVCLESDRYGNVRMNEEGDILLNVDAYDGSFSTEVNRLIMHTSKDTYLFFDGESYKEYGATQLTEEEFMNYESAGTLLDKIGEEVKEADTASVEFSYYRRSNGILHIQYAAHSASGSIRYGYYTVRCKENTLPADPGEYTEGQMAPCFSDLEVVY